jgi:hypothetical protein
MSQRTAILPLLKGDALTDTSNARPSQSAPVPDRLDEPLLPERLVIPKIFTDRDAEIWSDPRISDVRGRAQSNGVVEYVIFRK